VAVAYGGQAMADKQMADKHWTCQPRPRRDLAELNHRANASGPQNDHPQWPYGAGWSFPPRNGIAIQTKGHLAEFFAASPLLTSGLVVERVKDSPRDIDFELPAGVRTSGRVGPSATKSGHHKWLADRRDRTLSGDHVAGSQRITGLPDGRRRERLDAWLLERLPTISNSVFGRLVPLSPTMGETSLPAGKRQAGRLSQCTYPPAATAIVPIWTLVTLQRHRVMRSSYRCFALVIPLIT